MPIPLQWFAFPVNVILVLTLIFAAYLISIIPKTRKFSEWLSSDTAFISALVLIMAGSLIIGLVPQQHSGCVVTLWNRFYQSWILATTISYLFFILILRTICLFRQKQWKSTAGRIVLHIGLITILIGGYYGMPDEETCRMDLSNLAFNNQVINTRTEHLQLFPYTLKTSKIEEEKYTSGQPKRITAHLVVIEGSTERLVAIQAGHPLRLKPYALHLRQYRNQGMFSFCSLLIIKNPWRWWIYIGMGILLLGCLLEMQKKQYLILLGLSVITAIIFLIIKLLKPEIFHRELMPALQSDWFIPHVTLYMMSFLLLAISFIICMIWIFKKNDNLIQRSDDWMQAGLVLFITAMLIGSIWAEAAWGHFWTWDLKETWALITYVIYVIYLQYRTIPQYKTGIVCLWHTLAFLALQICWYGVNYLPAASESIHIYH